MERTRLIPRLLAGFRLCTVQTGSAPTGRSCPCPFSTSSSLRAVRLAYTKFEPKKSSGSPVADHPLFILHGLFGSKQNWQSLAKVMADRLNQAVIGVDARNHGESQHDPQHSYEDMCEDVEELLQQLGIPRAIFIGHSMGGKTAMCLALRKVDLVDALIVVDAAPATSPGKSSFGRYVAAMKTIQPQPGENLPAFRKRALKELEGAIPELMVRQFIVTNLSEKDGKVEWRNNLEALEKYLDDVMEFPVYHNFYGGPVLFIAGGDSGYITSDEKPEIKRLFPKAEIVTVNGAGHWVHSEKPKEVVDHIVEFLKNKEDH